MSLAKKEVINFIESIHLRVLGYFERDKITYLKCSVHGIVPAYIHGHKEKMDCLTCYKAYLSDKFKEGK